jgi:outer membrane protein assembly factor BamB
MNNAKAATGVLVGCVLLLGARPVRAQDWPQWRGANRDNKVTGFTAPKEWPKELTQKWKKTVGMGHASPVLVGDKVYVFSRQGGDEVISCLDTASGEPVWQDKYTAVAVTGPAAGFGRVKHTGPRSTPAVADGKVCTLGVGGVVSCLDAATGKVVWRKETKQKPMFFTSTSPLIADGKCLVYLNALTAFDLADGGVKWKWSGGTTPYGSPVLMTVDGTQQVVTPTGGGLAGVALADGKLLWEFKFGGRAYQSTYGTPVIDGPTVIYSAGKAGTVAFKVEKEGDKFTAREVWKKSAAAAPYYTPVLKDGLLYSVSTGRTFYCMDARTGEVLWKDTKSRGECGTVLDAGAVLLALTSDATLVAFRPSNKAYEEVARYKLPATDPWAYPIIAGNRVFVKDRDTLTLWAIE